MVSEALAFRIGHSITNVRFCERKGLVLKGNLFISDEHTSSLFQISKAKQLVLEAGENGKTWSSVEKILQKAVDDGLGRDSIFTGIGGGVVCDLAAFAASVYMRGTGLSLVPTTLLAMVDASLGGKTGFDFSGYKNVVGTFYPAQEIIICTDVLGTLPQREYRSGLAEVIKTALIGDADLLNILETERSKVLSGEKELMTSVIRRCLSVKGNIVEQDFNEKGVRAFLNFGHTFGHALESASCFTGYTHGEAVAWGIRKAIGLGELLGITESCYAKRVYSLLESYGYPCDAPEISPTSLLTAMKQDKKKREGRIRFVLQKTLCDTAVLAVGEDIVLKFLGG